MNAPPQSVTVTELNTLKMSEANPYILDVREDDEIAVSKIDTAIHLPMATVPDNVSTLPKDKPIYVICRSGRRSQNIADYLNGLGYDAYNVTGGMQQWQADIAPEITVA